MTEGDDENAAGRTPRFSVDAMSIPRVNARTAAPDVDAALVRLNVAAAKAAADAGISAKLIELVQIRASQINGCASCAKAHVQKAVAAGETVERLGQVAVWEESGYFDATERAALELVEAVTLIADGHVSDEVYARVSAVLTESQYAALLWLSIAINAFNRVIVSARPVVVP